jgi:hypothetical protein
VISIRKWLLVASRPKSAIRAGDQIECTRMASMCSGRTKCFENGIIAVLLRHDGPARHPRPPSSGALSWVESYADQDWITKMLRTHGLTRSYDRSPYDRFHGIDLPVKSPVDGIWYL